MENVLKRTLPVFIYKASRSLAAAFLLFLAFGFFSGLYYIVLEHTLIHTQTLALIALLGGILLTNIFFWSSKGKYSGYDWGILMVILVLTTLFTGFSFLGINRLLSEKQTSILEYVIFASYEKRFGAEEDDEFAVAVIYRDKKPMHVRLPAQIQGKIPDKGILRIQKSKGFFGYDVIRSMEIQE